jgi:hypothetical protein
MPGAPALSASAGPVPVTTAAVAAAAAAAAPIVANSSNLDLCSSTVSDGIKSSQQPREIAISASTAEVSVMTDTDFLHHATIVTATPSSSSNPVPKIMAHASTALDVIQEAISVGGSVATTTNVAVNNDSSNANHIQAQNPAQFVYQTPPRRQSWNKQPIMATPSPSSDNHVQQQQPHQLVTSPPALMHSSAIAHIGSSSGGGGTRRFHTATTTPLSSSNCSSASSASPYTLLNPLSITDWQGKTRSHLQFPELLEEDPTATATATATTAVEESLVKRLQQGFRVKVHHDSVLSTLTGHHHQHHHRVHLYLHADQKRLCLRGCEEEKKDEDEQYQVDSWEEIAISNIVKLEFGRKASRHLFNPLQCFSIAVEEPPQRRPYGGGGPGAGLRFYDFEAASAEEREVIVSILIMVLESSSSPSDSSIANTTRGAQPSPSIMPMNSFPRTPPSTMRQQRGGDRLVSSSRSARGGGTRDQPILCSPSLMDEASVASSVPSMSSLQSRREFHEQKRAAALQSRRQFHEQKRAAALLKRPSSQFSPLSQTHIFSAGGDHTETSLVIHTIEDVSSEESSDAPDHNKVPRAQQDGPQKTIATVQAAIPSMDVSNNSNSSNTKKTYSGSQIILPAQPVGMVTSASSSSFPVIEASLAIDVNPSSSTIADVVVGEPAKEEYVLLLSETLDANKHSMMQGAYSSHVASPYETYKFTRAEKVVVHEANDMGDSKSEDASSVQNSLPIPTVNGIIPPIGQSSPAAHKMFDSIAQPSRANNPSDSHNPQEISSNILPDESRPTVVARPRTQPGSHTRPAILRTQSQDSYTLSLDRTRQEAYGLPSAVTRTKSCTVSAGNRRQESYSSLQLGSGTSLPGSNAFYPNMANPESYATEPEVFLIPATSTQPETYDLSSSPHSSSFIPGPYALPNQARREAYAMTTNSGPEVYVVPDVSEPYSERGRSRPQAQVLADNARLLQDQPILDSHSPKLQYESAQEIVSTDRQSPLLGNGSRVSPSTNSSVTSLDNSGKQNATASRQQHGANDTLRQAIPLPELQRNSSSTKDKPNHNATSPPMTMATERQVSGSSTKGKDHAVANRQRLPSADYSTKSNSSHSSRARKAPPPAASPPTTDAAVVEVSYNTYVERGFAQATVKVDDSIDHGQAIASGRYERRIGQKRVAHSPQKQQEQQAQQTYQPHMGERHHPIDAHPIERHQSRYEPTVVQAVQRKPSIERETKQRRPSFERKEEQLQPGTHSYSDQEKVNHERKLEQNVPDCDPIEHIQPKEQRQPSHESSVDQKQPVVNNNLEQRQRSQPKIDHKPRPERNQDLMKKNGSLSNRAQPFRSSGDPLGLFNPDNFQLSRESIPEMEPIDRPIKKAAVIEIRKPVIDVELLQSDDYSGIPQKYAIVERKPIIDVTSLSPSTTQNFDHIGGTASYQMTGGWCADDFCTTTLHDMANTCSGIFAIEQLKQAQAQVSCFDPSRQVSCFDPTLTEEQMLMIEEYITSALGAPSAMYSFLTEGESVWDTGLPGNPPQAPQQQQQPQPEDMASSRVRNRASQMNAQANRMRTLRNEMTFAAALKQSKARMHVIRTTQSFDDAKLPQIADKAAKEFHASALLDMLVKNMMAHHTGKEAKAEVDEDQDIAYYDSDPEDSRPRTLHQGPRRISAERRNQAPTAGGGKVKHQRALSGIGLDNVGARLGRKMDEHAIVEIVQAMVNERLTLMWHPTQCTNQPNRAPILTRVWIEAGVHLLDGTFLLPKLTWTKAYEDDKSQQFRAELHKVDLLDICRIRATEKVDRTLHPFANRRLSFVIETQNKLFLFEAETMKERDRIVSGLKVVVARLASLLMLRDIRAADEFFGAPVVPGESPQWTAAKPA